MQEKATLPMTSRLTATTGVVALLIVMILVYWWTKSASLQPSALVKVNFGAQEQYALHSENSHFGCSNNGCPLLPSNQVPKQLLQQLPTTFQDLISSYCPTSWVDVADVMASIQSPRGSSGHEACRDAKYLITDDISTVSGLGYSMVSMAPLALQVRHGQITPFAVGFLTSGFPT